MKVYFAPKIMQALVIPTQNLNKEAYLMHLEDIQSFSLRTTEQLAAAHDTARFETIHKLSKDLSKIFGVAFPTDNYEKILEKLVQAYHSKENLQIIRNIECSLSDLYKLVKDTQKIIELVELGTCTQGKLRLKRCKMNIKVKKEEFVDTSKDDIAKMFMNQCNSAISDEVTQYVYALKQELEESKGKKSEDFHIVDPEFDRVEENIEEFGSMGTSSMSTQEILAVKYQRKQKALIKEKEWEKHEIVLLKQQFKNKKKKLKNRISEQHDMERMLKKKNLDIEREKAEIERIRENYYREKKRIQANFENKTRKLSEFISDLVVSMDSVDMVGKISPITETEMLSDISYMSDSDTSFDSSAIGESDLGPLQKRISDLETQYRTENSAEVQERLKRDIDSLKNTYTNLRSVQALKTSNSNQKRFSFMKNISLGELNTKKPIPLTVSTPRPRHSLIGQKQMFKSTTVTPKSGSQTFNFTEIFPKTEENELKKFLRAQEVRIREKEEKLERDRDSWMERWNRTPNANQLIPMVQKEILEYKKKYYELEKKLRELEAKELTLDSKGEELNIKEKDIETRLKEANEIRRKLEDEKSIIVQKLEKLKEDLER